MLIVADTASQSYKRSLEAPDPPSYYVKNLETITKEEMPRFHNQYDVEANWPECAWYSATEKGIVHRFIDRLISRHNSVRKFFKDVCCNLQDLAYAK
jgi:hypothetical protein